MDEKPPSSTWFVENLEMVLVEKLLIEENNPWQRKILLNKKPQILTWFGAESFEVVLDEKLLLGEKTICGRGKSCWMKNLRV